MVFIDKNTVRQLQAEATPFDQWGKLYREWRREDELEQLHNEYVALRTYIAYLKSLARTPVE